MGKTWVVVWETTGDGVNRVYFSSALGDERSLSVDIIDDKSFSLTSPTNEFFSVDIPW